MLQHLMGGVQHLAVAGERSLPASKDGGESDGLPLHSGKAGRRIARLPRLHLTRQHLRACASAFQTCAYKHLYAYSAKRVEQSSLP